MLLRYGKCMLLGLYCLFVFFPSNAANDRSRVLSAAGSGVRLALLATATCTVLQMIQQHQFFGSQKLTHDMYVLDVQNAHEVMEVLDQEIDLLAEARVGIQETREAADVAEEFNLGCSDIDGLVGFFLVDPELINIAANDFRWQQEINDCVVRKAVQANRAFVAREKKWQVKKNYMTFVGSLIKFAMTPSCFLIGLSMGLELRG